MVRANWQKIEVAAQRPYPVFLGVPLEDLGEYLESRAGDIEHILVITQQIVAEFHLDRLLKGLGRYQVDVLEIPVGEGEKSLERLSRLTGEAIKLGADRGTLVLAFGGGVIGDLAGFFASAFMRGVRFVQIPTTLLAQVDSSIGGKVAVNHPLGKNLLGAFYPPLAVWTDFTTLESLPWNEMQNGLSETIKHAVMGDAELFAFLEEHVEALVQRHPDIVREMAVRSLAVKVRLVVQDEKEQGLRALLNLGHSFGHALETEMAYEGISHGQGVSVGVVAAANLAQARGLLSGGERERIVRLLQGLGLPTFVQAQNPLKLVHCMEADKKNRSGKKVIVAPKGIGQAVILKDCSDEEILQAWRKVITEPIQT
ncbi:MAG: 3-dehydroquinate synthase [Desulfitobacteriaceae bacterium]|nr:3-dehydroquinate synthase [Desulfitobacteriaceae bacterium]MDI6878475.1 3-dehydroquinate synthase [Desulfitobacteriaceae bacterium]MDI6913006.1 3-dehydroquinate synthase [Desulfitobacteriaceae bacterium]